MSKKNIIITESQFEKLLTFITDLITGKKLGNLDLASLLGKIGTKSTSYVSTDFKQMVDRIIDNFEGGYYSPVTTYSPKMGDSGETMYGIDRKHGGESKTGKGLEFWTLIDEDKKKHPNCYKLGYDPAKAKGECYNPGLANNLKRIIAEMMKPQYDEWSKMFLTDESRKIINSTPELLFNFTYCVWNGSGYFQKFSKVINEKVKSGIKDPKELSKIMLDYRKNFSSYSSFANNLIQRGGKKMEKLFDMT